jgi:glutaminyl-peptide cyclotransferase
MCRAMKKLMAICLLWAHPVAAQLPVEAAQILHTYPHDSGAFTEGLFWHKGLLYESTGLEGQSDIRQVRLETGAVVRRQAVPPDWFGEGIALAGERIYSLSWKNGMGAIWDATSLKRLGSFHYSGEGWGLATFGNRLVMSDGTPQLRIIAPQGFKEEKRITVLLNGKPLGNLNELEYMQGELLANVWMTDYIARIDLKTGQVLGLIDVSGLHKRAGDQGSNPVPNGIAWDAVHKRLFVTGKNWPFLFEIALPHNKGVNRSEAK